MKGLRVMSRRLAGLFHRSRHDAELREELESLAALQLDGQLAAWPVPCRPGVRRARTQPPRCGIELVGTPRGGVRLQLLGVTSSDRSASGPYQ